MKRFESSNNRDGKKKKEFRIPEADEEIDMNIQQFLTIFKHTKFGHDPLILRTLGNKFEIPELNKMKTDRNISKLMNLLLDTILFYTKDSKYPKYVYFSAAIFESMLPLWTKIDSQTRERTKNTIINNFLMADLKSYEAYQRHIPSNDFFDHDLSQFDRNSLYYFLTEKIIPGIYRIENMTFQGWSDLEEKLIDYENAHTSMIIDTVSFFLVRQFPFRLHERILGNLLEYMTNLLLVEIPVISFYVDDAAVDKIDRLIYLFYCYHILLQNAINYVDETDSFFQNRENKNKLWEILVNFLPQTLYREDEIEEEEGAEENDYFLLYFQSIKLFNTPDLLEFYETLFGREKVDFLIKHHMPSLVELLHINLEHPFRPKSFWIHDIFSSIISYSLLPDEFLINDSLMYKIFDDIMAVVLDMGTILATDVLLDRVTNIFDSNIVSREEFFKYLSTYENEENNPYFNEIVLELFLCLRKPLEDSGSYSYENIIKLPDTREIDLEDVGDDFDHSRYLAQILISLIKIDTKYFSIIPWEKWLKSDAFSSCIPEFIGKLIIKRGKQPDFHLIPFSFIFHSNTLLCNRDDTHEVVYFLFVTDFVISDKDDDFDISPIIWRFTTASFGKRLLARHGNKPFHITQKSFDVLKALKSKLITKNREYENDFHLLFNLSQLIQNGWNKNNHRYFPQAIKDIVFTLVSFRYLPQSPFSLLPDELFFDILSRSIFHNFHFLELIEYNCTDHDDYLRKTKLKEDSLISSNSVIERYYNV